MCDQYNGYSSYPTWNVALWIGNDEYSQSYWQEAAEEADSISQLADRLEDEMEEQSPTVAAADMYADLLGWTLQSVDWYELAEGYWQEYHAGERRKRKRRRIEIMSKHTKDEQEQALTRLFALLQPGDTILTSLRHVSRSGMSRVIQLIAIKDNQLHYIGYNAAIVMGKKYDDKREGIVIGGCGMDMGFALVYDLSYRLFADGYRLHHRWL